MHSAIYKSDQLFVNHVNGASKVELSNKWQEFYLYDNNNNNEQINH